ncbi:hypothetical protein J4433_00800 [Candidatus Pacearchaeota archaeon]|nr:hypothetical protein [Candidatus Pacearchaeota archaeon]
MQKESLNGKKDRKIIDKWLSNRLEFTRNPYKRLKNSESSFVAISNPKFASDYFNEDAWQDTKKLAKEFNLPLIIAGGILPQYYDYYSKTHFKRRPRKKLEDMIETTKNLFGDMEQDTHYVLGPEDLSNMVEIYSSLFDVFVNGLATTRRNLKDIVKYVNKTRELSEKAETKIITTTKHLDKEYNHALKSQKKEIKEEENYYLINHKLKVLRKELDKKKIADNRRVELKKKLRNLDSEKKSIEERIKEGEEETNNEYAQKKTAAEERYSQRFSNYLFDTSEKIEERLNAIKNQSVKSKEELGEVEQRISKFFPSEDIKKLSEDITDWEWKETTQFIDKISRYSNNIETLLHDIDEEYIAVSGRIVKRRVPEDLVNALQKLSEEKYIGLLKQIHKNLKIHPNGEIINLNNNVNVLVKNPSGKGDGNKVLDRKREKFVETYSRRNSTNLGIDEINGIDVILVGDNHLFNAQPFSVGDSAKQKHLVLLGPFFDIDKERKNGKISEDSSLANKWGATSGAAILDYHSHTPRFTFPNLEEIGKISNIAKDDECFAVSIKHGDEHIGKDVMRREAAISFNRIVEELADFGLVDLRAKLGDFIQFGKYYGAAREGYFIKPNIERQLNVYRYLGEDADKKIVKKSRLKESLIWLQGNHISEEVRQAITAYIRESIPEQKNSNALEKILEDLNFHAGLDSKFDEGSTGVRLLGYESYYQSNMTSKDGKDYGKLLTLHKIGTGGLYKTDPVMRATKYLYETGLIMEGFREVDAGHAHVPAVGKAFRNMELCFPSSLEHPDRKLKHKEESFSPFGIMVGFPYYFPIAFIRSFVPPKGKGPATHEFITDNLLEDYYEKRIDKDIDKIKNNMNNKLFLKLVM